MFYYEMFDTNYAFDTVRGESEDDNHRDKKELKN